MITLDGDTLKKRLRYQGEQYSNGQKARGGSPSPHMLTQAADRLQLLEEMLDVAWDAVTEAGYEGFDNNLKDFMEK